MLSKRDARRLTLLHQGLLRKATFGRGLAAAQKAIERLSYVQIDTISVIERAHHHVLYSRVENYEPSMLDRLLSQDKGVFEYWSHAAAYLPMRDYRFSLARKRALQSGERHWYKRDPKLMKFVLDRIKAEGPLQSKDFAKPPDFDSSGMWNWKPAKVALEQLFMEGKLMIAERKGFQKVFDIPERVLPSDVDTAYPSEAEFARYLIRRGLEAHGFLSQKEIGYLRKGYMLTQLSQSLQLMLAEGELVEIEVEGLAKEKYVAFPDLLNKLPLKLGRKQLHLLSPFDNLVIQRKRLEHLFDYSYQIECYVPAPKRQYGYFSLPILWGDEMVGRMDPKVDRKTRTFMVKSFWLEPKTKPDQWLPAFAEKLKAFAAWNGCEEIVVESAQTEGLKRGLVELV
ncbi:MAG: crosslink repair DNA glycosylase YcaQ family protein [Bacteroidota bacterium]